ncbi:MAG TPA: hypothetical protein VGX92_16900 [Pyrinomonadaceae bacterium]|nr:hypothetical protein [Pyrinomonadaceae bacterium]
MHRGFIGRAATLALLMTLTVSAVYAQKGTRVVRRVRFASGRTTAVLKGKARWGTSYIYILRARAGQTLTVHVAGVPVFRIVAPGARNYEALEGADNVKDWSGELPLSGDYKINLGHADDAYADAPYTLEVTIR